ncbi:MAG TPA: HAD family phosphatase [Rhizomicrobium sp.]|jgi:HAD superfamily hydrolase (TIGR01509 family)
MPEAVTARVSAILFDCDGVLADSEILAHEIEIEALAEIGLTYDYAHFCERFMGLSYPAFFEALDEDALTRLGRSVRADIEPQMHGRYLAAMRERLKEVPGALSCVSCLPHKKAVASSSTGEALELKLRKLQLWDHFAPHIYCAEHVTHAKPAPDIFLHAAEALGVAPQACVVIEDSVNGVAAARAAGMRVWGFRGGGHMNDVAAERLLAAGAERVVADWAEAAALMASLI